MCWWARLWWCLVGVARWCVRCGEMGDALVSVVGGGEEVPGVALVRVQAYVLAAQVVAAVNAAAAVVG